MPTKDLIFLNRFVCLFAKWFDVEVGFGFSVPAINGFFASFAYLDGSEV